MTRTSPKSALSLRLSLFTPAAEGTLLDSSKLTALTGRNRTAANTNVTNSGDQNGDYD